MEDYAVQQLKNIHKMMQLLCRVALIIAVVNQNVIK